MLVAVLHFVGDEHKPAELVVTLFDALPPGSYLVASHITAEHNPAGSAAGQRAYRAVACQCDLARAGPGKDSGSLDTLWRGQ